MAWNQLSSDPLTKLNRKVRGWESKGLRYWQGRLAEYDTKVRAADNSGTLGRMIEQKDMAAMAVYKLSQT